MDDKKFWICLSLAGMGPVRTKRLLETCGAVEKIFRLSFSELEEAGIPGKIARNIIEWENLPWKRETDFCVQNGISVVSIQDEEYPASLKQIFDPPSFLFVKGALPADNSILFSIVGTRNPSSYGIKMAEKFAEELTYCGFVIVSGMARGIDTAAHNGALKAGGRTVAVTGCGFGQCYPPENRNLSKRIEASGTVLTEFLSDTPPEPGNFPRRNRIVSGLCRGVLVVEAGQKSGALITAHLALEQGREVFALPGRIDALTSKGANQLLKEGASLVESPNEIIAGLNLEIKKPPSRESKTPGGLNEREKAVYGKIAGRKKITIDELLEDTDMGQTQLFQTLVSLTVKNLITELPGKIYTPA